MAVEVEGLVKRYGATTARDGITFQVARGEIFAVLGPNGAGKTTCVEILEGYRRPDRGIVRVLGAEPASAGGGGRDRIGVLLQTHQPELVFLDEPPACGGAAAAPFAEPARDGVVRDPHP
jgi:ABC-type multidrug transport system ATPase subunit